YSEEAKRKGVEIAGLRWPSAVRKLQRTPVIGYPIQIAIALVRLPVLHRQLRRHEFHQFAQQQRIVDDINRLQEQINAIATQLSTLAADVQTNTLAERGDIERVKQQQNDFASRHADFAKQIGEQLR